MKKAPYRRLFRSRKNRIIGGVCAGLGEYFAVDPVIIRLLWVVLSILSFGGGIIAYLIFWIIVPEKKG